jgi:hypothetical protein
MPFNQELPVWAKVGTKPPATMLNTTGWQAGDKPPADWLNWLLNSTYLTLKELQEESINVDQKAVPNGIATLDSTGKLTLSQRVETTLETVVGDLNNYKKAGSFYVPTGIANIPFASNSYYMQVYAEGALALQVLYGRINPSLMYMRRFNGTWSAWDNYSKGITDGIASLVGGQVDPEQLDIVTTHQAEDATDVHNATSISVADPSNKFTATNVEAALLELFTFASDGKTAVANAVTAKGVTASPSDTFPALATKIGQISTGKKFATGTTVSSSATTAFERLTAATIVSLPSVTVTGLGFTPQIVMVSDGSTLSGGSTLLPQFSSFYMIATGNYSSAGDARIKLKTPAEFVSGGFKIPFNIASANVTWVALGE